MKPGLAWGRGELLDLPDRDRAHYLAMLTKLLRRRD